MKEKIKEIINSFLTPNIILSLLGVFIVRLLLSFLPSFSVDMGTWLAWAHRLADLGPAKFYSDSVWTQYTPGFLYWLFLIGRLGLANELAIKIPVIIADIVTAGLIWSLVRKVDQKFANLIFFVYVLSPAIIFNGSVWGQIDGIFSLFLFLSFFFLLERKSPFWSGIFWGVSLLIKPQAAAILPILIFTSFKKFSFKGLILTALSSLTIIFIGAFPFFRNDPIFGLPDLLAKMGSYYSYTSVFAYNIWTAYGMWLPDTKVLVGVSLFWWGIILYALSIVLLLLRFRKNLDEKENIYLIVALSFLAFFLFPTRIHERYLFPVFPFLLTYAGLKKSKGLLFLYGMVSFLNVINLYYPYAYYEKIDNILKFGPLQQLTGNLASVTGFLLLISYLLILFWDKIGFDFQIERLIKKFTKLKRVELKPKVVEFENVKIGPSLLKIIFYLILGFTFFTRVFDLGSPPKEYFDEVYHAFTAKVILHGDPKAWEWWNTPPTGFAYEWTHPPLAKLGMFLGMKIFGENSLGWRIPGAILGVGSVLLVYLIAKEIFKDEILSLIAASVFSLDGLVLVMSRIGMNDSYILFFSLLTLYLFLKEKNFFSGVALGLALSSKWSALWVIPVLFAAHIVFKKKLGFSYLWFFILPPIVYLASYTQMFLTGHGIDIWWGMQKQMWWYHTRLRATHPYTSPWWTWPFLVRPIYLYTSDEISGWVSRIYAMGNPLVFWFGIVSIFLSGIFAFFEKNRKLGWVVFSYLIFFAPWALSPRIMFLYHYLPSIPFMAIATGYVLRKNLRLAPFFLVSSALLFLYFYPHWAGLSVPLGLDKSYYWFSSWR